MRKVETLPLGTRLSMRRKDQSLPRAGLFSITSKEYSKNWGPLSTLSSHTHLYMVDLRDFSAFERVRPMFFKNNPPASTVVEVSRIAVNDDCLIEIEPIALVKE